MENLEAADARYRAPLEGRRGGRCRMRSKALIVWALAAAPLAAQVTVRSSFEGGNIGKVEIVSPTQIRCAVPGQADVDQRNRQASWYYLELANAPRSPITVELTDIACEYDYSRRLRHHQKHAPGLQLRQRQLDAFHRRASLVEHRRSDHSLHAGAAAGPDCTRPAVYEPGPGGAPRCPPRVPLPETRDHRQNGRRPRHPAPDDHQLRRPGRREEGPLADVPPARVGVGVVVGGRRRNSFSAIRRSATAAARLRDAAVWKIFPMADPDASPPAGSATTAMATI